MHLGTHKHAFEEFLEHARWVARERHVSIPQQLVDLWRLRPVALGAEDYFKYGLFDRQRFPRHEDRLTFRGWRFAHELRRFSDPQVQGLAFHKHILYRLLESWGFPTPRIHALYSPTPNGFERHAAMTSREQLFDYLRTTDKFPFFGKPSNASRGFGAKGVLERLAGDRLRLLNGDTPTIAAYVAEIDEIARRCGTYLLLELLEPREDFRQLSGPVLPSCRVVVLVRDGEPELFHSAILLPVSRNHISNFHEGSLGSLAGRIDGATGVICDVMSHMGPDFTWVTDHAETGRRVEGFRIEGWDEGVALVLRAARALAPLRMQHWDLTFTNRGPALLELNFIGDIEVFQLFGPPGIFTEQFRTFYETQKVW